MRKPGCVEPVEYYRNATDPAHEPGYVMLAPYTGCPAPPGYATESRDTLPEIRELERRLQAQERRQFEREALADQSILAARVAANRDRLYARMISSDATAYERDFLREWIKLQDDKKSAYYATQMEMYLWALHHDIGKRAADEEVFVADRHTVSS